MHSVASISNKIQPPYLEVQGNCSLKGEIKVSGAKNSALVLMAASLLTEESLKIQNIPQLTDIKVMSDLLRAAGVVVTSKNNEIDISTKNLRKANLPYELVHALRASFVCIGPLLARLGEVNIPLPGGCRIGARPIDEHIKGLKALGANVTIEDGLVSAKIVNSRKKLQGSYIRFNCKSVGATETILMAATLAEGETVLENAAQEPEIQDLAEMLNKMGANVKGAGSSRITIKGVNKLNGTIHTVIPDRIEAGTFLIAAAMTRSSLKVSPVIPNHLESLIEKLKECGCTLKINASSIEIIAGKSLKSVDITTNPFPGFPTDLQAPFMALMTTANGTSKITEKVFENRMQHVAELQRMGGDIQLKGSTAVIEGIPYLSGTYLSAGDLRASAAMIIASLSAQGTSIIQGLEHLDRGYEQIEKKLNQVGGNITRKNVNFIEKDNLEKSNREVISQQQEVA